MPQKNNAEITKNKSNQQGPQQARGKDLRNLMEESAVYGEKVRQQQSGSDEVQPVVQQQNKSTHSSKKTR